MRRICVYAGSNPGSDPAYAEAARALAELLAGRGIGLVYGGGHVGLMGVLADTALAAGGEASASCAATSAAPTAAGTTVC